MARKKRLTARGSGSQARKIASPVIRKPLTTPQYQDYSENTAGIDAKSKHKWKNYER